MQPASYPARLPIGHRATRRARRRPPRDGFGGRAVHRGERLAAWLGGLPQWVHKAPYAAMVLLGAVLLLPGVVPHGPVCGEITGAASPTDRELFIRLSAVAFGLVAALLLLSALAASAQRRAGRPGLPTSVSAGLVGAVALAAMICPHAPVAAPVQAAMVVDLVGLLLSAGVALIVPAVAGVLAWSKLSGRPSLRAAQISAWTVLLVGLPLMMAITYLTVTPICWG